VIDVKDRMNGSRAAEGYATILLHRHKLADMEKDHAVRVSKLNPDGLSHYLTRVEQIDEKDARDGHGNSARHQGAVAVQHAAVQAVRDGTES
jgi:hypothetical protein